MFQKVLSRKSITACDYSQPHPEGNKMDFIRWTTEEQKVFWTHIKDTSGKIKYLACPMNYFSWYRHLTSSVVNYAKQQFWHGYFSACSPLTHPASSSTCIWPGTTQITLQNVSWFTKRLGLIQSIVATSYKQITAYSKSYNSWDFSHSDETQN